MSRAVTLTTLISDVRFLADAGGASVRHTDAQITRRLNQAIQAFRRRISDEGSQHYLRPYSGTLGVGPTSPFAFYQLDLSSGPSPALVRTYGIDVTIEGVVCKLEHVPFESRNDYGTIPGGSRPIAWAHFRTDQVAILPASSSAYAFTVWYLPVFTDLSAGGDTFDGVTGWEDYIVADVVCQLIARDQFPQAYQIALDQRNASWENIVRDATKVTQAGGAHVGRDSFGSKLPHFLGGSRPRQAVAGGPYVPAGGSVTDAMLVDMTGPTVKGVLSGTTRPYSIGIGTLTTYLSQFSTLQRGLVPPPLGLGGLFLQDDGTWAAPAGGGGGGSVGPSGAVQYQAGTGMAGASGFRIHGLSGPSLIAHLDGTFRITGGQLQVGSGTVRVSASGIDVGGGSIINVATLVASALAAPAFTDTVAGLVPASAGGTSNYLRADGQWVAPSGAHQFPPAAGATNAQLAVMASGTVKANLAGNAVPSDVAVATLHAFAPTFTATQPGTVPGSGGGTDNYLRADGTWAQPPGAGSSAGGSIQQVQYNNGVGGFNGAAGVKIVGSGTRLVIGAGTGFSSGNLQFPNSMFVYAANASGAPERLLNYDPATGATGALQIGNAGGAGQALQSVFTEVTNSRGFMEWRFAGASSTAIIFTSSGADLSRTNLRVRGLTVASGIPNSELSPMASGTVKAQLGADAVPNDVPIATLFAFAPTFTSARMGMVPNSDGAATSYLAGNGTWTAPSGAHQFPPAAGATNAQLAVMASGTVKGNLSGSNTPSDVPFATFMAFAPTFTSARAGIVPNSDGSANSYLSGVGTWTQPSGAPQFPPSGGVLNSQLAPVASGTVKGNLGPSGPVTDIAIPTLHAFAPTFTATKPGTVPASGGGSTTYLRADGVWDAPPGGSASPGGALGNLQYHNGVGFGGASGVNVVASGAALAIGASVADRGDLRVGSGFLHAARNASGIAQPITEWWNPTGTLRFGSSGLARMVSEVASGGVQEFSFGGVTGTTARWLPTGLDASAFHIKAKSIDVEHINGLPATANNLKRGANIPATSSGVPSGLFLYAPRGAASGANRYIVASGTMQASGMVFLRPSGARAGEVIRIERIDTFAAPLAVCTPTGTVLHAMPSGTKSWADFMYTKPSGPNFELAGHADMH